MATLYAIADELLTLDVLLEEAGGELTDEIVAWMKEYGDALATKADRTGAYVAECEARAAACKAEEARLAARRKVEENKVARIKKLLESVMLQLGRDKIAGERFTIARVKNGGKLRLDILADAESFPDFCVRSVTSTVIESEIVRDFLDADGELKDPTGEVLAKLAAPTYSVRIK